MGKQDKKVNEAANAILSSKFPDALLEYSPAETSGDSVEHTTLPG